MNIMLSKYRMPVAVLIAVLASCVKAEPMPTDYSQLISKTNAYPASYAQVAQERGRVETVEYSTSDYALGTNETRNNKAQVYVPYGYDANASQRYNILYLVHGHYGNESTFLSVDNELLRNVLDHMIENGDIYPLIVVTPTYNYGSPTSNYVAADPYCRALPLELQNDLIPIVEGQYRTYALATDSASLAASRDHRAIGGFSMGGVTTWYALDETLSMFRWFLPMSGDCWSLGAFAGMNQPARTAQYLAQRIEEQGFGAADFYIWAASGTGDSAYRETLNQIEGMATADQRLFGLGSLTFHEKDGARHEYAPMVEYVYNALPFFFPGGSTSGIGEINVEQNTEKVVDVIYNLQGMRFKQGSALPHGVYIVNGKKAVL